MKNKNQSSFGRGVLILIIMTLGFMTFMGFIGIVYHFISKWW